MRSINKFFVLIMEPLHDCNCGNEGAYIEMTYNDKRDEFYPSRVLCKDCCDRVSKDVQMGSQGEIRASS